ncbi:MAG: pantoate--beta-alanine ligase [Nitrospira sp.]|nr:pantoate--beta-alanine ligase [Candidatus Manganitrophaceae bacterium]HIL33866.1 pantoate--beta-alanine ligase [Candidatus Manganitrophaceae bacterium]
MKTIKRIKTVQEILERARRDHRIAFVPTMGAFHEGHLSLMRKAKRRGDFVIVSLFVNPLQFGPSEDFQIYPRNLHSDQKKAKECGVDLFWTPSPKEIFPPPYRTFIEVEKLSQRWEGKLRPGHFKGVATIVVKLLQLVSPNDLYLGQKDFQQIRVIQQMIRDLHFKTTVRLVPTVRERDGLAMSSRNVRLSSADRKAAPVLYRALQSAQKMIHQGERDGKIILEKAKSLIRSEPRARIDYLALCDPETLDPLKSLERRGVFLAAVKFGNVRLIDNILIKI